MGYIVHLGVSAGPLATPPDAEGAVNVDIAGPPDYRGVTPEEYAAAGNNSAGAQEQPDTNSNAKSVGRIGEGGAPNTTSSSSTVSSGSSTGDAGSSSGKSQSDGNNLGGEAPGPPGYRVEPNPADPRVTPVSDQSAAGVPPKAVEEQGGMKAGLQSDG